VAVIEDRGPYIKGRIVDLNKPAAKQLGITKSGIDHVTIERIY
jgi:rare lipoprotein A